MIKHTNENVCVQENKNELFQKLENVIQSKTKQGWLYGGFIARRV